MDIVRLHSDGGVMLYLKELATHPTGPERSGEVLVYRLRGSGLYMKKTGLDPEPLAQSDELATRFLRVTGNVDPTYTPILSVENPAGLHGAITIHNRDSANNLNVKVEATDIFGEVDDAVEKAVAAAGSLVFSSSDIVLGDQSLVAARPPYTKLVVSVKADALETCDYEAGASFAAFVES